MDLLSIKYPKTWDIFFDIEINKDYFQKNNEKFKKVSEGKIIYPAKEQIYRIFWELRPKDIKVVILGQDPYYTSGDMADGLSFSVSDTTKIPASLRNIYKELLRSGEISEIPESGNLLRWVKQGVFLLNVSLTVFRGEPNSNLFVWQEFSDNLIKFISETEKDIVFMLWGNYAQKKEYLIDKSKHYVLKTSHPSPLSASKGFLGSDCFKLCNKLLQKKIIW